MAERLNLPGDHPGDWPEDFSHENGCYMNRCCGCCLIFHGHKRRVECKVCAEAAGVAKDIRVGDEWARLTNSGYITRRVTAVEDGRIFYRGPGEIRDRECSMATFQRWAKGAGLDFATDWNGRDAYGVPPGGVAEVDRG